MYILFDIGGTKTRITKSVNLKKFSDPIIYKTPKKYKEGIAELVEQVKKLSGGKKIKGAAGGIAGALDYKKSKLVSAPNLKGWIGKPFKRDLTRKLKTKVFVENDSAMVGLGETVFGPGKGRKIVVYMTISTGVGGARFVDGHIDVNTFGFEPGHQIIDIDGSYSEACKLIGDLEDYISGSALEKRYHKKAFNIKSKLIWNRVAKNLAYGLNNTIVHWSPEMVILGGSVTKDIPLIELKKQLKKVMKVFPRLPVITKAKLKDVGGLYGAMHYLKTIRPVA